MKNFIKQITFNCLKHHLLYARELIKKSQFETNNILNEIKSIGNNIMDLYVGSLSTDDIISEISNLLIKEKITDKKEYKKWLTYTGYKTVKISDNSLWVLRLSNLEEAYIHVHPARTGEHTIRISGSAWKTSLATAINSGNIPPHLHLLEKINFVRTQYLELSPVKKIIPGSNLYISLGLLESKS